MSTHDEPTPQSNALPDWMYHTARTLIVPASLLTMAIVGAYWQQQPWLFELYKVARPTGNLADYSGLALLVSLCAFAAVFCIAGVLAAIPEGHASIRPAPRRVHFALLTMALLGVFVAQQFFAGLADAMAGRKSPNDMVALAQTVAEDCPDSPFVQRIEKAVQSPQDWERDAKGLAEQVGAGSRLGLAALELAAVAVPARHIPEVGARIDRITEECVLSHADRLAIARAIVAAPPEQLAIADAAVIRRAMGK